MLKLLQAYAMLMAICYFSACAPKNYSLNALPKTFIEFGSHGGFTGAKVSGYLFPNGQASLTNSLFQDTSQFEYDKKELKKAIKVLKNINFQNLESQEPGNMNFYIRLKKKSIDHTVTWNSNEAVPKELTNLYSQLNNLIPQENEE